MRREDLYLSSLQTCSSSSRTHKSLLNTIQVHISYYAPSSVTLTNIETTAELKEWDCVFAEHKWTVKATVFGIGDLCLTAVDPAGKLAPGL